MSTKIALARWKAPPAPASLTWAPWPTGYLAGLLSARPDAGSVPPHDHGDGCSWRPNGRKRPVMNARAMLGLTFRTSAITAAASVGRPAA